MITKKSCSQTDKIFAFLRPVKPKFHLARHDTSRHAI